MVITEMTYSAFIYCLTISETRATMATATAIHTRFDTEDEKFACIKIYACANKTYILSLRQCRSYCRGFGLPKSIRPTNKRGVTFIGGRKAAVGMAVIKIPFDNLGVIIYVKFLLIDASIPSLMSLGYLHKNCLYISIKRCVIKLGRKEQKMEMVNFSSSITGIRSKFLMHSTRRNN